MTPRRYFYETFKSPYFQSEEYKKTNAYKTEKKIEDVCKGIACIPRRFWAGIKKTLWPL